MSPLNMFLALLVVHVSEKSKKTYGHFSDYGSIYRVDMVMICTYKVRVSFRSGL